MELLSIIIRSTQFTSTSEKTVKDIASQLAKDKNKKIRIEGHYSTEEQRKMIQVAIDNTINLLYKNKVNKKNNQITSELADRTKERTTAAGPVLRIVGTNFDDMPGLSNPSKTN